MNLDIIKSCLHSLKVMIRNIVKRAYVSNSTDDSGDYPTIQISYLSPPKTAIAERISPYGLYTNLPKDIQVLVFSVQGNEENKACIGYSQTDRFKNLKEGEVLIGNPQTQCFVKFDKDGNIDITCGSSGNINITSENDINVKAVNVKVDATKVDLGVGGNNIARLGDAVQVNPSTHIGTITSAGTNTST